MSLFNKKIKDKEVKAEVAEKAETKKVEKAVKPKADADQPDPNRNMSWFKGK